MVFVGADHEVGKSPRSRRAASWSLPSTFSGEPGRRRSMPSSFGRARDEARGPDLPSASRLTQHGDDAGKEAIENEELSPSRKVTSRDGRASETLLERTDGWYVEWRIVSNASS